MRRIFFQALRGVTLVAVFVTLATNGLASPIQFGTFDAVLTTGSLAGVTFPVAFSYDASQIDPSAASFIELNSLDFNLLGTAFTRDEIAEGGQLVFLEGVFENMSASYQQVLPAGAPVTNITFGFGGPGIIGYYDLNRDYGSGTFTLVSDSRVPEPGTLDLLLAGLGVAWGAKLMLHAG